MQLNAIWIYVRKRSSGCNIHCKIELGRISKGQVAYVFFDTEKAFDRVPIKVMERAMRKKGLLEVMFQAVMSLYDGVRTRVRLGSAYSESLK